MPQIDEQAFQGIHDNRFYILTHPEYMPIVTARLEAIVRGMNPPPLIELMALLNKLDR